PDIRPTNQFNPIWSICDTKAPDGPEFEAGMIVVDKRRHWPELQLALHFNQQARFYYHYLHGDKDTFQLAWRLRDARFAMPSTQPEHVYAPFADDSGDPDALTGLWQHDFSGNRTAFHHTDIKLVAWGRNPHVPGFPMDDARDAALAELRRRWDGHLVPLPQPDVGAATAHEVAKICWFHYARPGDGRRHLELLPNGDI